MKDGLSEEEAFSALWGCGRLQVNLADAHFNSALKYYFI